MLGPVEDTADLSAAPLEVGVGVGVSAWPGVGIEGRLGLLIPFAPRLGAELRFTAGVAAPWDLESVAPVGTGTVGVRWSFRPHLEVAVGSGVGWRDGPAAVVVAGIAWRPEKAARLELGFDVTRPAGGVAVDAIVEVAPRAPALVPSAEPVPEPLVWVPHPVCDWVPASEAEALVGAAGLAGAAGLPGAAESHDPRITAELGGVVVVAAPGDTLTVGALVVETDADGTAVIASAEGPVVVEIRGGGREAYVEGEVSGGYTLWLRPPPPPAVVFADGVVMPTAIAPLITLRGRHRYEIVARWAPGEDPLAARARGEQALAALAAAGLPAGAVLRLATEAGTDRALTIRSVGP